MFTTLISFLGGSVFRIIWGEVSAWLTASQEHRHELARLEAQAKIDKAQHARNMETLKFQAEAGVTLIETQGKVDIALLDSEIFGKGVELANKPVGIKWVDAWSSAVRPALATLLMVLVALHFYRANWLLDDRGWELAGATFGIFISDRMLFRRGK